MSWDLRQTYLAGMSEDESVPVGLMSQAYRPGAEAPGAPGLAGPQVRENVETGADVIDLAALIRQFEANPDARRRPLEGGEH
jgi:hypothetical protein